MAVIHFPTSLGSGGDNSGMPPTEPPNLEPRIANLEASVKTLQVDVATLKNDVTALKIDVAVVKSNYATKEDMGKLEANIADAKSSIIMWVVGTIIIAQVLPQILRAFKLIP